MTAVAILPKLHARVENSGRSEDWILIENLQAGIYHAMAWMDLESWIVRIRQAYKWGKLDASQVEDLMDHAILVSRYVPEQ